LIHIEPDADSSPLNEEAAWESEVAAAPESSDSVWEQMLSTPEPRVVDEPEVTQPPAVKNESVAPEYIESVWEQMLSTPEPPVVDESVVAESPAINGVKELFNLSDYTYELVREFYDENKDSTELGLLKNDLLRYLLNNARNTRSELQDVTAEDVDRALKTVDTDEDEKINLDEFVQLLSFFFSSKNNLKQRINGLN